MLALIALGACLVGRLHVYVGSWGTNRCFRKGEHASKPPISGGSMFVMWFSGLRGGVAFALASVSYADADFSVNCGGLAPEERAGSAFCQKDGMSDSLAILQTTLAIASFTIFVFGGAITDVCKWGKVLATPESIAEEELLSGAVEPNKCHEGCLLPCLTFETAQKRDTANVRQVEAVQHAYESPRGPVYEPMGQGPGKTTEQIKRDLAVKSGVEMTAMLSLDDKLDELRLAFPAQSTNNLKKLLDANAGNLQQAIIEGQKGGFL